jgi:hypothetical protein
MIALSRGLAGFLFVFPVLRALVVGGFLALLLWHDKRADIRRQRVKGVQP